MPGNRQLAAILFVDIVGYTSMMQVDETTAVACQKKLRKKLGQVLLTHRGKLIEFRGDGALCKFASTINGVKAAIALQICMQSRPVVPLRIGMHTGDVIVEGKKLYGDALNIASRMESFAIPGSILISGKAHDDIKNQKGIKTVALGSFSLKNVKENVEIFAVSNPGILVPSVHEMDGKGQVAKSRNILIEKSVAVLPFINLSNDPSQDYLGEGITEEIVNSLTQISELKIAGRVPQQFIRQAENDRRIISEKLGVNTLVEGSIQKIGDRLRITARLVNAVDGFQIWSGRYDSVLDDFFAIQDEIAIAVSENLKVKLLTRDRENIQKKPTEHKKAYDLYLRGRFHLNRRGAAIKKAFEYFQQAIALDPGFALPYAGLADAYSILSFYGSLPPKMAMPKARSCAEKAIELDPLNVEAYTTLSFIAVFYDWDWQEAKKYFKKTFEIDAGYAQVYYWFSFYLSFIEKRFDEAILYARQASQVLEPLVSISHHVLSVNYINAGLYIEGLKEAQEAVDLDPHSFPGLRALGLNLALMKRYDESIEIFKKCLEVSERHSWPVAELAWVYSLTGNHEGCLELFEELHERSRTEHISCFHLAAVAYFAGQFDLSVKLMQDAYDERSGTLPCINVYPLCEFARRDPRFRHIIEGLKFPRFTPIAEYSLN